MPEKKLYYFWFSKASYEHEQNMMLSPPITRKAVLKNGKIKIYTELTESRDKYYWKRRQRRTGLKDLIYLGKGCIYSINEVKHYN